MGADLDITSQGCMPGAGSLQAKSDSPPGFVNKAVLEHIFACRLKQVS